jgi:hypothetical protein
MRGGALPCFAQAGGINRVYRIKPRGLAGAGKPAPLRRNESQRTLEIRFKKTDGHLFGNARERLVE